MAEHWKQMERMGEGDKTDKKDYALFPIYYVFYMSKYVTLNDQGISFFLKSENSKYVVVNRYRSKICRSWIPKRTYVRHRCGDKFKPRWPFIILID